MRKTECENRCGNSRGQFEKRLFCPLSSNMADPDYITRKSSQRVFCERSKVIMLEKQQAGRTNGYRIDLPPEARAAHLKHDSVCNYCWDKEPKIDPIQLFGDNKAVFNHINQRCPNKPSYSVRCQTSASYVLFQPLTCTDVSFERCGH